MPAASVVLEVPWSGIEIAAGFENVVCADACVASRTAGAPTIVTATQIRETLDILASGIAYPLRP